ncbi:MAG TPA: hypothetical protein VG448_12055, partial [Solirubrobacterales bacterium]|nr:hypothetical protein [Solirubrobacterales bacterium]
MDLSREEHRWYALIGAALAISAILLLVKQFTNDNARSNTIAPITPRHASHASTEAPRAERAPKPESAPKPTPAANPKPAPASQPKPKRAPAHR